MSDDFSGKAGSASPAIRLGADLAARAALTTRWQLMLVWFMRLMAVLWMLQGFLHWHSIMVPVPSVIETLPPQQATAVAAFAVLDLLTAVGLWLVTPWGGVLWIFAVAAQMTAIVTMPGLFPTGQMLLAIDAVLVLAYFVVTYQAGLEGARRGD